MAEGMKVTTNEIALNWLTLEVLDMHVYVYMYMCMYMWEQNFIITVPADVLAPNSARPSAGTMLNTEPFIYIYELFTFLWLYHNFEYVFAD